MTWEIFLSASTAFFAGASTEALWVVWVHYAERNDRLRLFITGILVGIATVLGLGAALQTNLNAALFVLGYGVGSLAGLWVKNFMEKKRG